MYISPVSPISLKRSFACLAVNRSPTYSHTGSFFSMSLVANTPLPMKAPLYSITGYCIDTAERYILIIMEMGKTVLINLFLCIFL